MSIRRGGRGQSRRASASGWAAVGAVFHADFVRDRYLGPAISVSRPGGTGTTVIGPDGRYQDAPANTLRREYIPAEERTNWVRNSVGLGAIPGQSQNANRNNTFVGAVPGTPGTLPYPLVFNTTGGNTSRVIGTGVEDGIQYIDLEVSGSSTGLFRYLLTDAGDAPAAQNQRWTGSAHYRLIGGSLTNITFANRVIARTSGSLYINDANVAVIPTSAALSTQRIATTMLMSDPTTGQAQHVLEMSATGTFSVQIRIGLPQLEQAPGPGSFTRTTGTAAAATAGTNPLFWNSTSTVAGINRQIVGTGVEGDLSYWDYRYSGTATATTNLGVYVPEAVGVFAATVGQTWTGSAYATLVAGTAPPAGQLIQALGEANSGNTFSQFSTVPITLSAGALASSRVSLTRTFNQAGTATFQYYWQLNVVSGTVYDFTIRVAGGQVERRATASEQIRTYGTALTVGADRTNAVLNSTGAGWVSGIPAGWAAPNMASTGLSYQALGPSTVGGIKGFLWRVFGTSSANANIQFFPGGASSNGGNIVGTVGQTWTLSTYYQIIAGTVGTPNSLYLEEWTSAGAYINGNGVNVAVSTALQRFSTTKTLAASNVGLIKPAINFNATLGATYDYTVFIAAQQEQAATPSEQIDTSGTAITRGPGVTGCRGVLVEEARTNGVRNSTFVGGTPGVIGSGGITPTNVGMGANAGLNVSYVMSSRNGLATMLVRVYGTTTAASASLTLNYDASNVPAVAGQTWTVSTFARIVSSTGVLPTYLMNFLQENTSVGGFLVNQGISILANDGTFQRYASTRTLTEATTAGIIGQFYAQWATSGSVVDITFEIAQPQIEQGFFASSPIRTSGVTATRAADVITVPFDVGTYTALRTAGTLIFVGTNGGNYATSTYPTALALNSSTGSGADRIEIGVLSATMLRGSIIAGGTNYGEPTVAGTFAARSAAAYAYSTAGTAISVNGSAISSSGAATIPNLVQMQIGGGVSQINGYVEQVIAVPFRRPDSMMPTQSLLSTWGG